MTVALRLAPSATLAPLEYLEIVSAAILSWLVFGDWPDATTWTGVAVIVASGLYVIHRERVTARRGHRGAASSAAHATGSAARGRMTRSPGAEGRSVTGPMASFEVPMRASGSRASASVGQRRPSRHAHAREGKEGDERAGREVEGQGGGAWQQRLSGPRRRQGRSARRTRLWSAASSWSRRPPEKPMARTSGAVDPGQRLVEVGAVLLGRRGAGGRRRRAPASAGPSPCRRSPRRDRGPPRGSAPRPRRPRRGWARARGPC